MNWQPNETAFLLKTHGLLTATEQARWLGRSERSVSLKIYKLRRTGQPMSRIRRAWTSQDTQHALCAFDAGIRIGTIARQLGRTPLAVSMQLQAHDVRLRQHMTQCDGDGATMLAMQLGISKYALIRHIRTGRLKATRRSILKRDVYSIAPDDVRRFLEQHPYLSFKPDPDWLPIVERARETFERLYVGQRTIVALLHINSSTLGKWRHRGIFPAPALYGDRQPYYDRSAVRSWLDSNPIYWTKAAREGI